LIIGVLLLALLGMGPVGAVATGGTGEVVATTERTGTMDVVERIGTTDVAERTGTADAAGEASASDVAIQRTCNYESLYNETIRSVVTIRVLADQVQGLGSGFVYD
jgi:hypothetical protein